MENKNTFDLKKATTDLVKIEANDKGEHIVIDPNDSFLFDMFVAGYQRISSLAEDTQRRIAEIAKKYDGKDDYEAIMAQATEISKLNVAFSEESVTTIDSIFGEGTIKKYFRNIYDEIPTFLPNADCIYEFIENITPVMEKIFRRGMDEKKKQIRARTAKYKPTDYKSKG